MADETEPEAVELTEKQQAFVLEYLKDLNRTAAAIRAGYSPRSAKQISYDLMTLPEYAHVQAAVEAELAARSIRTQVDADYVIRNLTDVVDRCMQARPVMVKDGKAWTQAKDDEGEGVWQFDAKGANTALTTIARHLGMLTDKKEISGPGGGPLDVNVTHEVVDPKSAP